jgi:hypothetical protein
MNDFEKTSEPKVMRSAAGYYIGCTYPELIDGKKFDFPYDRYSHYFKTEDQAREALPEYL